MPPNGAARAALMAIYPMVSEVNPSFSITPVASCTGSTGTAGVVLQPVGWAKAPAAAWDMARRPPATLPTRSNAKVGRRGQRRPPPYPPPHAGEGREGATVRRYVFAHPTGDSGRSKFAVIGAPNRAGFHGWLIHRSRLGAECRRTEMNARTDSRRSASAMQARHVSVLLRQAIEHVAPRDGEV